MSIDDSFYAFSKTYLASPQWAKSTLGGLYRLVPNRLRFGATYLQYVKYLKIADRAFVTSLAKTKLYETLSVAVASVPAYRHFGMALDRRLDPDIALREFPYVTKQDLKNNPEFYVSNRTPEAMRLQMFTGGSTAEPLKFFVEKRKARPKEYAFLRSLNERIGKPLHALTLSLRGRTVPTSEKRGGRLWMYEPIKRHLILSSDHMESSYMPGYIAAIDKWKPTYIEAFPSAIFPIARWLQSNPHPTITSRVKGIVLVSENVYEYQMDILRKVFHCPILTLYGHSERVLLAASMADDSRYFFWPQYGKVELIDIQGRPITKPGEMGEIVGTSFDNFVMPFIRYRTGDYAMWSDREHPALPGYPVCERIEGRLQEFVVCKDRRLISVTTLGAAHFDELAIAESIQYEQRVEGHLLIKIQVRKPLSTEMRRGIESAIVLKTQQGCTVEVVEVCEILRTARGKHKMLLQHLDISSYLGASAFD